GPVHPAGGAAPTAAAARCPALGPTADRLGGHRLADRRGDRHRPPHPRVSLHRVDRPAPDAAPEAGPRGRSLPQERRAGPRPAPRPLEAATTPVVAPPGHLAAVKRGLKRGLADRTRTVLL